MRVPLAELARIVGGQLVGDAGQTVERIAPLETAQADCISFLSQARYAAQLLTTAAGCVIVHPSQRELALGGSEGQGPVRAVIVCDDPYLAFARLTQWWARQRRPASTPGIHASAVIEPGAQLCILRA